MFIYKMVSVLIKCDLKLQV